MVRFLTRLPVAPDMDSALVDAIDRLRVAVVPTALIDRSRQLDEALLRSDIDGVLTGPWIIDMARSRGVTLRVTPMPSILNGDVLAISAASNHKDAAAMLIGHLGSYANARAFCMAVSDAGFPADLRRAEADPAFAGDALTVGFLRTAQMSRPLPHSTRMLAIEPVLERMLDRCFRAKDKRAVEQIVSEARREVEALESR
jgi:maltose-binding protein MalE